MIQRAIIEMISSPTTYKVRIPELNGVSGFVHSTPTKYLQDATVCAPPNAIPNYVEGDIVYVAYERGEDPVIIGKLFTTKDDNTFQDVKLNNLSINGEIKIGNTSRNDLLNLSDTNGNIQEQINTINSLIEGIGEGGTVGALDTTATTSQATSASESFENNITLHKVSKTGDYNDLLNKPSPPIDTNQKVKTGAVSFGDNVSVEFSAGNNIAISGNTSDNTITISATDTTYTAGSGINITNGVISLDVSYASGNNF